MVGAGLLHLASYEAGIGGLRHALANATEGNYPFITRLPSVSLFSALVYYHEVPCYPEVLFCMPILFRFRCGTSLSVSAVRPGGTVPGSRSAASSGRSLFASSLRMVRLCYFPLPLINELSGARWSQRYSYYGVQTLYKCVCWTKVVIDASTFSGRSSSTVLNSGLLFTYMVCLQNTRTIDKINVGESLREGH